MNRGGWTRFGALWIGQVVSLLGTQLTDFALGVWVYERTGSAASFALIMVFTYAPIVVLGPIAGALVDRWDRRLVLILSDSGAALITLLLWLLVRLDALTVWHIYLAAAGASILGAFQIPAYEASISLLVQKDDLGRANGLSELGGGLVRVGAPALAGLLLLGIGIQGVILADLLTFLFAAVTLLIIRIPSPDRTPTPFSGQAIRDEIIEGWRFVRERAGLLWLLIFFAASNFMTGLALVVFTPMVLSFTSADVLGVVISLAVSGAILGGIGMAVTGGPKPRIHGVLAFQALMGAAMVAGGLRADVVLITAAGFLFWVTVPVINGSNLAIWQTKVAPEMQGRVFALRRMVSWASLPVAFALAGVLAEQVFEPLMTAQGLLGSTTIGTLIGTGPGRGIGLMFSLSGLLTVVIGLGGYLIARLRTLEAEIPDALPGELAANAAGGD